MQIFYLLNVRELFVFWNRFSFNYQSINNVLLWVTCHFTPNNIYWKLRKVWTNELFFKFGRSSLHVIKYTGCIITQMFTNQMILRWTHNHKIFKWCISPWVEKWDTHLGKSAEYIDFWKEFIRKSQILRHLSIIFIQLSIKYKQYNPHKQIQIFFRIIKQECLTFVNQKIFRLLHNTYLLHFEIVSLQ